MHRLDLHPRGWRLRLLAERGMAMPTVLLALVAAFGLAAATVVASVSSQGGSVRDQNTKAALGAAEAGVANALLRFNRTSTAGASSICVPVGGTAANAEGWCPMQPTGTVDRGSYAYWVRPTGTELQIVSTGAVDGATRRIEVHAQSAQSNFQGRRPFALASVVGLDSIYLHNRATVTANVATNGSIGLDGPESRLNCAYAAAQGFSPSTGAATCDPIEDPVELPPVNPGDVITNNSNHRICNLDPMQGQQCNLDAWNPDTMRLSLKKGASLTLGAAGGEFNYFFCQVELNSNSYLYVASGATVRIYFGSPDEPPCTGQSQPLVLHSGSKIQPTGGGGSTDLAILITGSNTKQTEVVLNADAILFDCDQSFVLYAPRTAVTLNNDTHICGGIAAKSVLVNEGAAISASNTASDFELPNTEEQYFFGYAPQAFVECAAAAPAPPSPPDAGC